jgi:hypothetical protein
VVRRPTRRHGNLFTHLTAAVVVPGCLALCWWQVTRALGGNTLSWAYVFEWPIFAGYAVFMWWKLIHDRPPARSGRADPVSAAGYGDGEPRVDGGTRPTVRSSKDVAEDEAMASYNRYLAALHASDESDHR